MATSISSNLPQASALTAAIAKWNLNNSSGALPVNIMHNLQYQHNWTDLRLHQASPTHPGKIVDISPNQASTPLSKQSDTIILISGMPPRHMYTHPDFLNHLVKNKLKETDVPVQREWILPLHIGQKWTLRRISSVFDCLQERKPLQGAQKSQHRDSKRVFLSMLSHNGAGGDGTVVYYIMQEGDIKPRQN